MNPDRKIFGVGMSKTGTTTLGECFQILGLEPLAKHAAKLANELVRPGGVERILLQAERYRSFEDSPWYRLYRELDQRFPGSKFILTERIDSATHGRSAWNHQVRKGRARGAAPPEFLEGKMRDYDAHNEAVRQHFKDRPQDLLQVCWERGDGWRSLCDFLEVPVPDVPFPHKNAGRIAADRMVSKAREGSLGHMLLLRARSHVKRSRHQLGTYFAARRSR